jgi:hypothetical protein
MHDTERDETARRADMGRKNSELVGARGVILVPTVKSCKNASLWSRGVPWSPLGLIGAV